MQSTSASCTTATDLKLLRASVLLDSDAAAAAGLASEILADMPEHTAACMLFATARRSLGDPAAAVDVLEPIARAQPNSAIIQLELGRAYGSAGDGSRCLIALRRALELEPNLADGWAELANQLGSTGDSLAADTAYARYTALVPPNPRLADAESALAENRLDMAEALLQRHLQHAPRDPVAIRLLAEVAVRRADYSEAERLLRECLKIAPSYSAARYDLAVALNTQQQAALVLPLVERLLAHDPKNSAYRSLKASTLLFVGQNAQAIEVLAGVIADYPDDAKPWMHYGHLLRGAGRLPECIDAYRRSIALVPGYGEAYWSLANLKTCGIETAELEAMRAQLARDRLPDTDRVHFEFALGKALEDEGKFAESFEHYAAGNALRRATLHYDADLQTASMRRLTALCTREFFGQRSGWGSVATDPIFIVGLPRSGSTLLEQMLASHSRIEGTSELPDIGRIAHDLSGGERAANVSAYIESLATLDAGAARALAERYLEQTRIHRVSGKPLFIDKMPNNFGHIALIQLLFPRSSIIDVRRHPLACCFSCFKQLFRNGQAFTYELAELGRYYGDYVELMAHFDKVLAGRIHRVSYEQLVANAEGELRALFEYCRLPFEPQCLRFYESRRVARTFSSEQVRRPIYSEAIDHWRHFEPWLGPLKQALGDLGETAPRAGRPPA